MFVRQKLQNSFGCNIFFWRNETFKTVLELHFGEVLINFGLLTDD